MTHRNIKIGVTVVVLTLAFSGLLWSTLRDGTEYYKHVDEVMTSPERWQGKSMQLHGFVVAKSIMVNPRTLEYRFKVQNNGQSSMPRIPDSSPTRSRTRLGKRPRSCSRAS